MKALLLTEARQRFINGDQSKRSWSLYLSEVGRIKSEHS